MSGRRRLFFDIETSPNIGFFWQSGYKLNIPAENILHERKIICIGYKWAGEKRVYCPTWDSEQDDRKMLAEFIAVMNTADEVVAHNGDRFDITWIRTRCLKHGIPMAPNYVSIDTLKSARRLFRFNSNRLNYIAEYLGLGGKIKTDFGLWKDVVFHHSEKALNKMLRYCKKDVTLLEEVFDRLNPYMPPKSRLSADITCCPECGKNRLKANKRRRYTPMGSERITLKCMGCGKYPGTVAASKWDARVGRNV